MSAEAGKGAFDDFALEDQHWHRRLGRVAFTPDLRAHPSPVSFMHARTEQKRRAFTAAQQCAVMAQGQFIPGSFVPLYLLSNSSY
jgi:hypothetical protein